MPALAPGVTDERDALVSFLRQQRDALCAAVHGLDEDQVRSTPTVSALSLAGLQETARHAGHADIIREAIDGANAFDLIDEAEAALV